MGASPSKDCFISAHAVDICYYYVNFEFSIIYEDRQYEIRMMDEHLFLMAVPVIIVNYVWSIRDRVQFTLALSFPRLSPNTVKAWYTPLGTGGVS